MQRRKHASFIHLVVPTDLAEGPAIRAGWLHGGQVGGWMINLPGMEKDNLFHGPKLIEMSPPHPRELSSVSAHFLTNPACPHL